LALKGNGVDPSVIPGTVFQRAEALRGVILPDKPETVIINDHHEAALIVQNLGIEPLSLLLEEAGIHTPDGQQLQIEPYWPFYPETLDLYILDPERKITKRARIYSDHLSDPASIRLITADLSDLFNNQSQQIESTSTQFRNECVFVERREVDGIVPTEQLARWTTEGLSGREKVAIVHKKIIRCNFGEEYQWDHRPVVVDTKGSSNVTSAALEHYLGMKPYLALSLQQVEKGILDTQFDRDGIEFLLRKVIEHCGSLETTFAIFMAFQNKKEITKQTRLELEYRGEENQASAQFILSQILTALANHAIPYQPIYERKVTLEP